jgi:hypothetical protein
MTFSPSQDPDVTRFSVIGELVACAESASALTVSVINGFDARVIDYARARAIGT